jgi:hypothetical protein
LASDKLALALGLFALSLFAASASAQGEGEPSAIDRDAARTLVQQGDERMKARDYEAALVAYRRADDIMGVPTTSIEVAKVELLLGHLVEAHAAFLKAARHPPRAGEPAPFTRARAEAREKAKELEGRIPRLSIQITGPRGSDAEVRIDGAIVDAWASPFPVNPGPHEISVQAEGYAEKGEAFVVEEGEIRKLAITLEALTIDRGPQPIAREETSLWPLAIAGFSVAGAGLLVGAVTGGLSLDEAATAKALCNDDGACPPAAEDPLDRSRTLAHVSTTSFVLAGVGAAVGIVGLVLSLDHEGATALRLSPGEVTLRLRF